MVKWSNGVSKLLDRSEIHKSSGDGGTLHRITGIHRERDDVVLGEPDAAAL
jgi:hypothetical protein